VRAAVSARRVEEVGSVTVSIGVAACPENASTERELFGTSDAALYHAKQEGRNQTMLAHAIRPAAGSHM
jgi:diguanylate cyclase (GGDEF)-like protein